MCGNRSSVFGGASLGSSLEDLGHALHDHRLVDSRSRRRLEGGLNFTIHAIAGRVGYIRDIYDAVEIAARRALHGRVQNPGSLADPGFLLAGWIPPQSDHSIPIGAVLRLASRFVQGL